MNEAHLEEEEREAEALAYREYLGECAAAFIDEIIGDRLYNTMFKSDPDGLRLSQLASVQELLDQYPFALCYSVATLIYE